MILQQLLIFNILFFRENLLVLAYEVQLAEVLEHATKHLLVRLKEFLDFSAIEKECASYRHQSGPGRPPDYSIALLARAVLVGWIYGLSLRQLEERLHFDRGHLRLALRASRHVGKRRPRGAGGADAAPPAGV